MIPKARVQQLTGFNQSISLGSYHWLIQSAFRVQLSAIPLQRFQTQSMLVFVYYSLNSIMPKPYSLASDKLLHVLFVRSTGKIGSI
jgi:hypothetical protein